MMISKAKLKNHASIYMRRRKGGRERQNEELLAITRTSE
jgi:hypothetical protein